MKRRSPGKYGDWHDDDIGCWDDEPTARAASEMEAAISRLGLEPEETTPEALAADDAAFPPAMVDGVESVWADGRKNQKPQGGE